MIASIWGPTYEEMLHPSKLPAELRRRALAVLESDPLSPLNLFNISWRNGEDRIRHVLLPRALTGIDAEICVLLGKGFPTGSHKVGPAYSCTVERQVRGEILPGRHRLVWPSTGNFGVGGAYVGERMGYRSLVVLPEGMSRERFEMIASYGAAYVTTPGSESNVKEIYDKTRELEREGGTGIVNQFSDFANYRFHYAVTGTTILELFEELRGRGIANRLAAVVSAMGSAGTIASGERAKQFHPDCRIVGLEPAQCPTLYANGFGSHDIQGIGDQHVTWIHNTDAMDLLVCVDEWDCKKGMQLLHEEAGWRAIARFGAKERELERLSDLFGISGICNVLGAIQAARHYRFGKGDVLFTVATDSVERYLSVLDAMDCKLGAMDEAEAERRLAAIFHGGGKDLLREGTEHARDCWAGLKYFTWVEQQGRDVRELRAQRSADFWLAEQAKVGEMNRMIEGKRGPSYWQR